MTALVTEAKSGLSVNGSVRIDEIDMRAMVAEMLGRHPAVGLAVGVVRDRHLEFFYGQPLGRSIPARIGGVDRPALRLRPPDMSPTSRP